MNRIQLRKSRLHREGQPSGLIHDWDASSISSYAPLCTPNIRTWVRGESAVAFLRDDGDLCKDCAALRAEVAECGGSGETLITSLQKPKRDTQRSGPPFRRLAAIIMLDTTAGGAIIMTATH